MVLQRQRLSVVNKENI